MVHETVTVIRYRFSPAALTRNILEKTDFCSIEKVKQLKISPSLLKLLLYIQEISMLAQNGSFE